MKKLENVRKDHSQRLIGLEKLQEEDKQKAELITRNQELVDRTILSVQMLLGQQVKRTIYEIICKLCFIVL